MEAQFLNKRRSKEVRQIMVNKVIPLVLLALGLATAPVAAAQSLSEMLQEGIYKQETLGDLDGAIKIFRQVVTEGKTSRMYAAQAQYRLGMCYLGKGQNAEATEAFNTLIKQYPEQKELVAKAREQVSCKLEFLPAPWVDGEVLAMAIKLPAGLEVGTFIWTAEAARVDGRDAWRLQTRRFIVGGENDGATLADVDRETLQPIRSMFKHSMLGRFEAAYEPNVVKLKMTGKDSSKEFPLDGVFYDNEQAAHLLRQLPLAVGYKTCLPLFSPGGSKKIEVNIDVTGIETLEVAAGKFECLKVEFRLAQGPAFQTFWYSADPRHYLVKFEGPGVVGELSEVRQYSTHTKPEYRDKTFGFSLTAPSGWFFYKDRTSDKKATAGVHILDAEADARASFWHEKLGEAKAPSEGDLRANADKKISERLKELKDYKVRPESWTPRNVAGAPALSLVADFVQRDHAIVEYLTWVRSERTDNLFVARIGREQFDEFRAKFDKVIESLRLPQ